MMRALASFGVKNPVVANLIVFTLLASGALFGLSLRREFFPEVRPNRVVVSAPYPGAGPDEIESSLVLKIEEAIDSLSDVVEMETTVSSGLASVSIEFAEGVGIDDAVAQVKRKIDALEDLPEQSERVVIEPLEPNLPAIILSYIGEDPEHVLKATLYELRDDLEQLDGMGDISVSGSRADEISVEVRPEALLEHGLALTEVSAAIRRAMAEVPAGSVRTTTSNVSVRTMGSEEEAAAVREIVVRAMPDGSAVRVGEIASVRRGYQDVDFATRLNGLPAVSLTAFKVGEQDAILISRLVHAYAAGRTRADLELGALESVLAKGPSKPARVVAYELGLSRPPIAPDRLVVHTDLARFIEGRLDLLRRNAMWGGVLVFFTLLLLLNVRVALWVTAGLIISVMGTLAFMAWTGITLNLLTMFGLIIVLGLLVDDGIVVAENITAKYEAGMSAQEAAIEGTTQVAWPVVATILTSIFAFGALLVVEGQMGDMMSVLPGVVVVALGVSLIEALFILPSHMGHSLAGASRRTTARGPIRRVLDRLDRARDHVQHSVITPRYERALRVCLTYRYSTLAVACSLLLISVGMIMGGRLPFEFLGEQDAETVVVDLSMPVGTPVSATDAVVRRLEAACHTDLVPEINNYFAAVGARGSSDGTGEIALQNVAQLWLELKPAESRDRNSDQVIEQIRANVGDLTGIKSLRMSGLSGGPEGPALTYTVTSDKPSRIGPAVRAIEERLAAIDGVYDITNDADKGQRELRITLRPGARELGLTTESVATQIRGFVYGLEAHTFAAPNEDVDVRVMLTEEVRRSLAAIEAQYVFTPDGRAVPISEVARIEELDAQASIHRLDRDRSVSVMAEVRSEVASAETVSASLAPYMADLRAAHPGVRIQPRGRQQEMRESMSTMPVGMLVAAALIYVTLAWLFGSYTEPLIVLCAVPFGVVGMVWGHLLLGFPELTFLSIIGYIALMGVIVNDALIFIEFYKRELEKKISPFEAAVLAGKARLRPILLTTTTTVVGLSPLMLETSFQARFLIPMAITISFGLIAATFIVLLVTPCLLLIGHDIRRVCTWLWWVPAEASRPAPAPVATDADGAEA